jgi:hypothetical protein
MTVPLLLIARKFAELTSSPSRNSRGRKRSAFYHAQLESLEGRALLAGPAAYPDTASYWVGDWQTANGDLFEVSEEPPHHPGSPPTLTLFYQSGYFKSDFTTRGYPYYALNYYDNNPDPNAATLSGKVYGDFSFSGQSLGTFVFHATPNANPTTVTDTFTGSMTVGGQVTQLQATFVGDIGYPASAEPGWGLPRDRPDTSGGINPPPTTPSGKPILQANIAAVGPNTITVSNPKAIITRELAITVTNVGTADLPAHAAHMKLKNKSKAAKITEATVSATIPLGMQRIVAQQIAFLRADLPSLAPGESEELFVTARETERFKSLQDTQTKIFAISLDITTNKAKSSDRAFRGYDEYVRP